MNRHGALACCLKTRSEKGERGKLCSLNDTGVLNQVTSNAEVSYGYRLGLFGSQVVDLRNTVLDACNRPVHCTPQSNDVVSINLTAIPVIPLREVSRVVL
jgi:hypothetical protein